MRVFPAADYTAPAPFSPSLMGLASPFSHLSLKMLFLLFLYYLLQGPSIDVGPIPTIENCSLAGNHCNDLAYCRTIWNIVWSCLVTIFSCTWVAVHPNVPCPKRREPNGWIGRYIRNPLLSFVEHHLPLFICALLVPEDVLAWAIRQFLRACKIAKGEIELRVKYLSIAIILSKLLLERGWSKTHGFFIIMGGFHLFKHLPIKTSNNDEFKLHDDDILYVHLPLVTSMEIIPTGQTGQASTLPHLRYRPRRKSMTRERATGSPNHSSCSKRPGS